MDLFPSRGHRLVQPGGGCQSVLSARFCKVDPTPRPRNGRVLTVGAIVGAGLPVRGRRLLDVGFLILRNLLIVWGCASAGADRVIWAKLALTTRFENVAGEVEPLILQRHHRAKASQGRKP
jgi:hypothetical protein